MGVSVRRGYRADLGWTKRIYVSQAVEGSAGGGLTDFTLTIGDAQINAEVETQTFSTYGTPNNRTRATSTSFPLVINTMYYTAECEMFMGWLESNHDIWWIEIDNTDTGNDQYAQNGTFAHGLYGLEGAEITGPTDNLVEFGITPTALGDSFEGIAYPFSITAAGNLQLSSPAALESTDRIWLVLTEVNGSNVTFTPTVGGTAADAVDIDETRADFYELGKKTPTDDGALVIAVAGVTGDGCKGYVLVGSSVVEED